MEDRVVELIRPEWPPLRHVRRGWEALSPEERAEVEGRVRSVSSQVVWPEGARRDALLHLFAFLAQVETIAIEIPLRFLPHAPERVRPILRRQLVDEVFHSTIFARLAHELALPASQPPAPLASAERLLDRIRAEPDLAITATLLNLVAEGWIETLFKHALRWRVCDPVFKEVLADEARHVHEAHDYIEGLDPKAARAAVHTFEQGMLEVGAEPTVALAILDLAGEAGQGALALELRGQHRKHLAEIGLEPSAAWTEMGRVTAELVARGGADGPGPEAVPDTTWRRLARRVWTAPRDPTMQGDFDVPIGHVPRKLLTYVIIAALGRAWKANPELNRIVARDGLWQLPHANVGVRVLLDDNELATVVIPEADKRSVRDIQRMLQDGIAQLRAQRKAVDAALAAAPDGRRELPPPEIAALLPPGANLYSIGLSNAGKWGLVSGAGSFSGWVSPSTDITVGVRRRLPTWRGFAYFPAWHINVAAIQDHRVFDGRASATTVTAIQAALSPAAVKAILRTPDSLPEEPVVADWGTLATAPAAQDFQMTSAAGAFAFLGLPKYAPYAIGGLGLGALLGAGGYMLYQHLNAQSLAAAAGSAASGVTGSAKAADAKAAAETPAKPGASAKSKAKPAPKSTAKSAAKPPKKVR